MCVFLSVTPSTISIHAPTRGATKPCTKTEKRVNISIHAPTRGATIAFLLHKQYNYISIHAPTRGATGVVISVLEVTMYFNPRSHERSDKIVSCCCGLNDAFQSTLPREERRVCQLCAARTLYFNPRSHERSDLYLHQAQEVQCLFQSTLPREERLFYRPCISNHHYFNPRSHERSDKAQKVWTLNP